jgi:hypothetical protein
VMGDEGPLFDAVMNCLMQPAKMGCGRVTASSKFMQDLMVYLYKQ